MTLARLERMDADRLDRGERVWMGVWGALTLGAAGVCVGIGVMAGMRGVAAWETAALFGVAGLFLLVRSVAYWASCIRGRRGGWVDELVEMLRGGS